MTESRLRTTPGMPPEVPRVFSSAQTPPTAALPFHLAARSDVQIVIVGANHNSAPAEFRERLWIAPDALDGVVRRLRTRVAEAMVVSTCNRVEIHAVCGHEVSGAELLRHFLAENAGVPLDAVRAATYAHAHRGAVRHALRVAAGLDSVALGEREILGQMRRAVDVARRAGGLGAILDRLAAAVLACGKRVRSTTALGAPRRSVASLGVRAAARTRGSLGGASVLVIGAGDMARLTLAELARHRPGRQIVVNRTFEAGAALARSHGAEARPWASLESALSEVDVVISCTSAPGYIISADDLRRTRATGAVRPVICVDLGMPRNIDPVGAMSPGITLLDIDRTRVPVGVPEDECDGAVGMQSAERVVAEEVERFMEWWRTRDVAPTIARLHARVGALGETELSRALSRLPNLSPREQDVVRQLAMRIVGKVLHGPTIVLKHHPEGANMAVALERLFQLEPADPATLSAVASTPRRNAAEAAAPGPDYHAEPVAT